MKERKLGYLQKTPEGMHKKIQLTKVQKFKPQTRFEPLLHYWW